MEILKLTNFYLKYKLSEFSIGPNFNLNINVGDLIGIVGESGCGKSTIGKVLIGLINQSESGNFGLSNLDGALQLQLNGISNQTNFLDTNFNKLCNLRKKVQMIFQNPRSSLNLKMPVINMLYESAKIGNPKLRKNELKSIIYDKVIKSGLLRRNVSIEEFEKEKIMLALNGKLSGGERRRVSIAKVMVMNPEIIIADEPLASLDASLKLNVLQYLIDEWKERKNTSNPLTLIMISHDISVISKACNRVIVMYGDHINKRGDIVEEFKFPDTFNYLEERQYHPYTSQLISAARYFKDANSNYSKTDNQFDLKDPDPSTGCVYGAYCSLKTIECEKDFKLSIVNKKPGHYSSCIKQ